MNTSAHEHIHIGKQKFYKNNREAAVVEFRKALLANSDNDEAIGWLATCLAMLSKYDEANDLVHKVNDSNCAEIFIARGLLFGKRDKNPKKALENYNRAISIDSNNQLAYIIRGMEYVYSDMAMEAMSDLEKALAINQSAYALFSYASMKLMLDDIRGALDYCNKAIEVDPELDGVFNLRAMIREELGDTKGALNDYDKVIELIPDDIWAWTGRGMLRKELDDYQGALQDFSRALEIDPNEPEALSGRASILRSMGKYELSIADQMKYYEVADLPEYQFENPDGQETFDTIRNHIKEFIIPELTLGDEKLIDYWEGYLQWGVKPSQIMNRGQTVSGLHGRIGMGYLCLSNRFLRIVSIGNLSRKYAKQFETNKVKKIFNAFVLSRHDMRRTEDENRIWTIPFKDIQGVSREDRSIIFSAHSDSWEIMVIRGSVDYLIAALELARTGNLKRVIDTGNIVGRSSVEGTEDDIIKKIEQLGSLKEKGIITHEEFERKKKELLARI